MIAPPLDRRSALRLGAAMSATAMAAACTSNVRVGPQAIAGRTPAGTVEMRMVQAAYIGSGNAGSGVLYHRGPSYPFTVAGAGIGSIGVSEIEASGDVYNLPDVSLFPGAYGEARYGFALGERSAARASSGCRTRPG